MQILDNGENTIEQGMQVLSIKQTFFMPQLYISDLQTIGYFQDRNVKCLKLVMVRLYLLLCLHVKTPFLVFVKFCGFIDNNIASYDIQNKA